MAVTNHPIHRIVRCAVHRKLEQVFDDLALKMHMMIAHIDSAAAASLRLHEKLGFTTIGTFREVARLHDGWLTLVAMQREI